MPATRRKKKQPLKLKLLEPRIGSTRASAPAVLSVLTGHNTTITSAACRAVGASVRKGTYDYDLIAAAGLLGLRLELLFNRSGRKQQTLRRWKERYDRQLADGSTYLLLTGGHWRAVNKIGLCCGYVGHPVRWGDDGDPWSNSRNRGAGFGWRTRVKACLKVHPRDRTRLDDLAKLAGDNTEANLLETWQELSRQLLFRRRSGSYLCRWTGKVIRPKLSEFASTPDFHQARRAARRQLARLDLYRNGPDGRYVSAEDEAGFEIWEWVPADKTRRAKPVGKAEKPEPASVPDATSEPLPF